MPLYASLKKCGIPRWALFLSNGCAVRPLEEQLRRLVDFRKKSKRLHNNVHLCHSICISSNKTLDVVHPVLFVNVTTFTIYPCTVWSSLWCIFVVYHVSFLFLPAVYCFPRFARAHYLPLLCLCMCHVTAGQPIRQTTNCSGRTAARWSLMSGFGG